MVELSVAIVVLSNRVVHCSEISLSEVAVFDSIVFLACATQRNLLVEQFTCHRRRATAWSTERHDGTQSLKATTKAFVLSLATKPYGGHWQGLHDQSRGYLLFNNNTIRGNVLSALVIFSIPTTLRLPLCRLRLQQALSVVGFGRRTEGL